MNKKNHNELYIEYTQKLLEQLKISTYIINEPYNWNSFYDSRLRETIWKNSKYYLEGFSDYIKKTKDTAIISNVTDSYGCEYFYIRLPDSESIFLIGPFTCEKITNNRITQLLKLNNIPEHLMNYMQLYYAALPCVSDERWIKSVVLLLAENLFKNQEIKIKYYHLENEKNIYYFDEIKDTSTNMTHNIEQRYRYENLLMEAIASGNLKKLSEFSNNNKFEPIKPRFPDTLRDTKNYTIILNTICRKAAEAGCVHPVYLDEISRKYAIQIEEETSLAQLNRLKSDMPRKYCMLVKSHSLKGYSKPVQDVMNHISLDITSDLSLSCLAEKLGINSSYLSNLFKKETNITLTAYVNAKRIERAIFLLNTTSDSIQNIACFCGINDVNYFTKVFKKIMNMTPSEYRNLIHKK
ncbi:MAG: helix-turn-helix transcriptional regulator [Eubacteriales bacterium]|nr:helix-turn-helix transcriptional regulator [Eubacteriales bacterium]